MTSNSIFWLLTSILAAVHCSSKWVAEKIAGWSYAFDQTPVDQVTYSYGETDLLLSPRFQQICGLKIVAERFYFCRLLCI